MRRRSSSPAAARRCANGSRMHRSTNSAETAVEPERFGRVFGAAKNSSPDFALQPVTGKMQQQHVVGRLCENRSSIATGCGTRVRCALLGRRSRRSGVAEHPPKRLGVRRGRPQVTSASCSYSSLAMIRAIRRPLKVRSPPWRACGSTCRSVVPARPHSPARVPTRRRQVPAAPRGLSPGRAAASP